MQEKKADFLNNIEFNQKLRILVFSEKFDSVCREIQNKNNTFL